jgi:hypothetical protein
MSKPYGWKMKQHASHNRMLASKMGKKQAAISASIEMADHLEEIARKRKSSSFLILQGQAEGLEEAANIVRRNAT